ncbi:pyridoxamine 5'-phosphate oxidase family protein [soil metagenome]
MAESGILADVGRIYDSIDDGLAEWIGAQPVFFVATAPTGADGHVNVSPRGGDPLAVLDARTVAWLDLTGSGVETIAHLRENGRICVMLCSFSGPPRIVRLHGRGEVVELGANGYPELAAQLPAHPGGRAVIRVACERIADSCGFGVPVMELAGPRTQLTGFATRKGPEGLAAYRASRNATSIDGLPGLDPPTAS